MMAIESLVRPKDLGKALEMLGEHPDWTPIAGGTDLMVQLRAHRRDDRHLVDLTAVLPEEIEFRDGILRIGAAATMDSVARSPLVREFCPALAAAASKVGAWPIQCRATLGGNLVNASPAADTAPPLLVAEASLEVQSRGSRRSIPITEFFKGPGTTVLNEGEILLSVEIHRRQAPTLSRFEKLGWRREQIISVVSLAVEADIDEEGKLLDPHVAFGAVAATPRRAPHVEALLRGKETDSLSTEKLSTAVAQDISPIDDLRAPAWYRKMAALVMLQRILREVSNA